MRGVRRPGGPCPLVKLPWTAAGILIGAGWYVAVAVKYGTGTLLQFAGDQLADKAVFLPLEAAFNALGYAAALLRYALLWSLLAAPVLWANRRRLAATVSNASAGTLFLAGWIVVHVALFSFSGVFRARYLSPAFPALAILVVSVLEMCAQWQKWPRWVRSVGMASGGVLAFAAAAGAVCALKLETPGALTGIGLAIAGMAIVCACLTGWSDASLAGIAFAAPAAMLLGSLVFRPMAVTFPAPEIARYIVSKHPEIRRVLTCGLMPETMAQIRLCSGGRIDGLTLKPEGHVPPAECGVPVLITSNAAEKWAARGYSLERTGVHWRKAGVRDIVGALRSGSRAPGNPLEILIAHPSLQPNGS